MVSRDVAPLSADLHGVGVHVIFYQSTRYKTRKYLLQHTLSCSLDCDTITRLIVLKMLYQNGFYLVTFHVFDQGKTLLIVEDNFDSTINGNLHEREKKRQLHVYGIFIIWFTKILISMKYIYYAEIRSCYSLWCKCLKTRP